MADSVSPPRTRGMRTGKNRPGGRIRPIRLVRNPTLNRLLTEIRQQLLEEEAAPLVSSQTPVANQSVSPPETLHLWQFPLNRLNRVYVQILSTPLLAPPLRRLTHRFDPRPPLTRRPPAQRIPNHRSIRSLSLMNRLTHSWVRWLELPADSEHPKNAVPAPQHPLKSSLKNISMSLSRGEWMFKVHAERELQESGPKNPAVGIDLGFVRLSAQINLRSRLPLNFLGFSLRR